MLHTVVKPRTEVLADERGDRHVEADDGQEGKALYLAVGAVCCGGVFAEGVYLCLHDGVCEGYDGVLHTGGQAVAEDLKQHSFVYAKLFELDGVDLILHEQMTQTQHDACRLRQHGCDRRRPHAPAEACNEEDVERNVQKRGEYQIVQGALAVTEGAHDASAGVVHYHGEAAEEEVAEVFDSLRQNIGVGFHPHEEGGGQENAHEGQHDAAQERKHDVRMYRTGNFIVVLCAEVLRHDDARTH